MIDIVVISDSLRKDVADKVIPTIFPKKSISLENCYTHCGWTPYALAHLFSGKLPSKDKALSLKGKVPSTLIWNKKRRVDTLSLNSNLVDKYDSAHFILFEWHSLNVLHKFYGINKKNVTKKAVNRYVDQKGELAFDYKSALESAMNYIEKCNSSTNKHLLFIRVMGTHAPYLSKTGVSKNIGEINKSANILNCSINANKRNSIHNLYKTLVFENTVLKGENDLLRQQEEGFLQDWELLLKPIFNKVEKSRKYNFVVMADHGDLFTKYYHLQGHAHYFSREIAHIPVYIASSEITTKISLENNIFISDIFSSLIQAKEGGSTLAQVFRNIKNNYFEFHCKDDYLFSSTSPQADEYDVLSIRKGISGKINIKDSLFISSKEISIDMLKLLNDRFIISKKDALRISTHSYSRALTKLSRSPYAKSFAVDYKSKKG